MSATRPNAVTSSCSAGRAPLAGWVKRVSGAGDRIQCGRASSSSTTMLGLKPMAWQAEDDRGSRRAYRFTEMLPNGSATRSSDRDNGRPRQHARGDGAARQLFVLGDKGTIPPTAALRCATAGGTAADRQLIGRADAVSARGLCMRSQRVERGCRVSAGAVFYSCIEAYPEAASEIRGGFAADAVFPGLRFAPSDTFFAGRATA